MQALRDTVAVASGKKKKSNPNRPTTTNSILVDETQSENTEARGVASIITSLNDASDIVKRQPPLIKVNVNQLSDMHVGNCYSIFGFLKDVDISEEETKLFFDTTNNVKIYAYIGNPYKESSRQAFGLLHNISEYLNQQKNAKTPVMLCCAGLVEKTNDDFIITMFSDPSFLIDNKTIFSLSSSMNK